MLAPAPGRAKTARRLLLLSATALASTGLMAPAASAASYQTLSCDAAPFGGKDDAWAPYSGGAGSFTAQNCPTGADSNRGYRSGMFSHNNNGSIVGHEFKTAPGTSLSKWEGKMLGFAYGDDNHAYGLFSPKGGTLRYGTGGNSSYGVGPTGTAVEVALPAGTRSLAAGVVCGSSRECNRDPGSSRAENRMFAAKVTVEDPINPTLTETGGTQSDSTPEKGNSTFRFDALDNVGIKEARLLIDGVEKDREQFTCDYSAAIPCADQAGKELSFDSTGVQDGTRNARVEILDAAGNMTSTQRSIVVANAARDGGSGGTGPTGGTSGGGGSDGGGSSSGSSSSGGDSGANGATGLPGLAGARGLNGLNILGTACEAPRARTSVTFKVSPRKVVARRQRVNLAGKVMVCDNVVKGVVVALQAKVGRKWVTFKNARTNDVGTFRNRYRFKNAFRGSRKYQFRARVLLQYGFGPRAVNTRGYGVRVRGR